MDRPVPGPTGSAPLFENELGEGSGLTELAQMQRSAGQGTAPAPAPAAPAAAAHPDPGATQAPPNLPPHLRGPQASPAPVRETHYGRWVIGTFALLVVGALAMKMMGDDGPEPAAQPAAAPAATASAEGANGPVVAAGPDRAQQWEQVATVLGELERHLNRAKLQFVDIPDPTARPSFAPPPPDDAPPPADGAPPSDATGTPPPDNLDAPNDRPLALRPAAMGVPTPRVDPAQQARAQEMWRDWSNSWSSDLDFAVKGLPVRADLDPSVRAAYDAVSGLAMQMRSPPVGNPPGADARDAWLRTLLERVHDARKTVDASR